MVNKKQARKCAEPTTAQAFVIIATSITYTVTHTLQV